jgi:sRNA-binding protein
MIKIEVTGNSIPEVADKLLSLGAKLRYKSNIVEMANAAAVDMRAEYEAAKAEVAEAAPVDPTPAAEPAATPASSSKPAEVSTDTSVPATSVSELSFETDVTPVVLAVVQAKGKPAVEEILSQFGVARASQLDPARWPELVAALKDQL